MLPRRFALIRHVDYTGVSGVGVVAYGVAFGDGHIVLRWYSSHPATSVWASMDDLLAVHGHGQATSVEWIDAPHGDLEELPSTTGGRRARRGSQQVKTPGGRAEQARAPLPDGGGPSDEEKHRDSDPEAAEPREYNGHPSSDSASLLVVDLSRTQGGAEGEQGTASPVRRAGRHRRPDTAGTRPDPP